MPAYGLYAPSGELLAAVSAPDAPAARGLFRQFYASDAVRDFYDRNPDLQREPPAGSKVRKIP